MGSFYSNIHLKKNTYCNQSSVIELVRSEMKKNGMKETEASPEAVKISFYQPEQSDWITIASELWEADAGSETGTLAGIFAKQLKTDAIYAGCFDSDWAYIGLIREKNGEEGWISVGEREDGTKGGRQKLAAWKKLVSDPKGLENIVKKERIFAEEMFSELAPTLGMNCEQTGYTVDTDPEQSVYLYFTAVEAPRKEPVRLNIHLFQLVPCRMEEPNTFCAYNLGSHSKGLGILFTGDYIQEKEITFKDVQFISNIGDTNKCESRPIELKRVRLSDGKLGLYWEDKDFSIPQAVDEKLPEMKRMNLIFKKAFGVRFTPFGNARKVLDIKVTFVPLENREKGQTSWYVYRGHKSKLEYLNEYNREWKEFASMTGENGGFLNPENYDL